MATGFTRQAYDTKTGKKIGKAERGTLTPITKKEFNAGSGMRMQRTAVSRKSTTPIVKTATRRNTVKTATRRNTKKDYTSY